MLNWDYAFSEVETASNAAARLTGFFFIKKLARTSEKALLVGELSAQAY